MTSEKQAQKFYTNDLGGTSDWLKHHPELGSGMSSERNFCTLPQLPFREKTSGGIAECQQFS